MMFKIGSTVIGGATPGDNSCVGIVIAQRTFENEGSQKPVNLLKVRFQNSNSTTGIYLSTEYETRLLNDSPAPGLIRLLEK
tara:strand:+ start:1420 stop:1662 length:243 start_codon:yes stop_codon:yes gene_type:complete